MSVAIQRAREEQQGTAHALTLSRSIIDAARERAQQAGLHYAGDVTPQEAWELFSSGIAGLVDVRTERELQRVGHVPDAWHVEWLKGSDMLKNTHFISELGSVVGKDDVVLFLCRSGKRSVAAAQTATQAGFKNVFNVLEGFEGDGHPQQGWLNRELPSAQD